MMVGEDVATGASIRCLATWCLQSASQERWMLVQGPPANSGQAPRYLSAHKSPSDTSSGDWNSPM